MRANRYRSCDFIALQELHARALIEAGKPEPTAKAYAKVLVSDFRRVFAGDTIYIPKKALQERENKKQAFLHEFNGDNRRALCEKYGVSKRTSFRWTQGG
jgi:Mor family transcriptional regulator